MNKQDWDVFGLVEQQEVKLPIVSEKLGISIPEIKEIMAAIRKEQPDLFFSDTERHALSRKICGQEQKKRNTYVVSYDARKDGADNVEEEIIHKF